MRLPRLLAGGAVLAVVAGTAACGAQALEPRVALRDALSDFAAQQTGAVELSVASSAKEVRAFAAASDPSSSSSDDISDDDLETVLSSSVEFGYDFGTDRKSDTDDKSRGVIHVGDVDAAEIRTVDKKLYAQADLDGLAKQFPDMQQGLDDLRSSLDGPDAPPELVAPATALLDGKWVSTDPQAYLDKMKADAGAAGPPAGPDLSDLSTVKARNLLGKALKDAVGSVARREADEVLGDHLVVSLDLRKGYTTLRAGLPGLFEGDTAAMLEQEMPPASEVPDKHIDVSFWVRDGHLSRVEIDAAQFLDKPTGHLVLRADTRKAKEITAPSDAVPFDLGAIFAAGMATGDMGGAAGPGEDIDAQTLATWVDMDIADAADQDGGQPSVHYLPDVIPYYDGAAPGLVIRAVGTRVQVAIGPDVVCLTLSADGNGNGVVPGPC